MKRGFRWDSDGLRQGQLNGDLQRHGQDDSCGDLQAERERDPYGGFLRELRSDLDRYLRQDSGGEFQGELRGDSDDPFGGRREK